MELREMYEDYMVAKLATDRAEQEGTEEEFEAALDRECEILDRLADYIMALTGMCEFDARHMLTNENYRNRFAAIVKAA